MVKGCVRGAHASLWFREGQRPESMDLRNYGDNLNDKQKDGLNGKIDRICILSLMK